MASVPRATPSPVSDQGHGPINSWTGGLDSLGQIKAIRYIWSADVADTQSDASINPRVE